MNYRDAWASSPDGIWTRQGGSQTTACMRIADGGIRISWYDSEGSLMDTCLCADENDVAVILGPGNYGYDLDHHWQPFVPGEGWSVPLGKKGVGNTLGEWNKAHR